MLALSLTVCTAVRTPIPATTACPALPAMQDPNRLAEVLRRLQLRNRQVLSCLCVQQANAKSSVKRDMILKSNVDSMCNCYKYTHFQATETIPPSLSRCARLVTHASMEATTATRTPAATTSDTSPTPCTAASASRATLATATSVEKIQTWMGGPMLTWCAWRTPPTTAKR